MVSLGQSWVGMRFPTHFNLQVSGCLGQLCTGPPHLRAMQVCLPKSIREETFLKLHYINRLTTTKNKKGKSSITPTFGFLKSLNGKQFRMLFPEN